MAVPGTIIKLRHVTMPLTFATLVVSIYESFRYGMGFGPLPVGDSYVLVWVLLCLLGSITGCVGTFALNKGALLAASLIFCCAMAPVTPNMIVLSQGDQYQSFIALTIFMFIVGGLMVALFSELAEEMAAREYLNG